MSYSQYQYDGSGDAGAYTGYAAGVAQEDPYYYYNYSWTNSQYGYSYQHISYFDELGLYDKELYEVRGPNADTVNLYIESYQGGVYALDVEHTTTPLDGIYNSYGTRSTSSYNANYNTLSTDDVSFGGQTSYSVFSSFDYQTGATVLSYDARYFYYSGFYESNTTFYAGAGGYSMTSYSGYVYNDQG